MNTANDTDASKRPALLELRQELTDAEQEVCNLMVMGMRPDLAPHKRDHSSNWSARAVAIAD